MIRMLPPEADSNLSQLALVSTDMFPVIESNPQGNLGERPTS